MIGTRVRVIAGLVMVLVSYTAVLGQADRDYRFDGTISRTVLDNYLSRAVTVMELTTRTNELGENIRMTKHMGAKFLGRAVNFWGGEELMVDAGVFAKIRAAEQAIHAADSDMIVQACIFEIITEQVNKVAVPEWVFVEFGLPIEKRNFRYDQIVFPDGRWLNHWWQGASVPDVTRIETQMWYYFVARNYIDIGAEAIHFGQYSLVGSTDTGCQKMWELLGRIRKYAKEHARRHLVLCDAHVSYSMVDKVTPVGPKCGENLLFDFLSFPLRIRELTDQPLKADLAVGYIDSLYGRSGGGVTPSGWRCDHMPYIVEFDNWGYTGRGGQTTKTKEGDKWREEETCWVWGWDEISWFAHQSESDRNAFLEYAYRWMREHDTNGFVQMPGMRVLADPIAGDYFYHANTKSAACPNGFNQEETIKAIWSK